NDGPAQETRYGPESRGREKPRPPRPPKRNSLWPLPDPDASCPVLRRRRALHQKTRGDSKMPRATSDAKLLIQSLGKAYAATPTNLKIIDLYVGFAVATALIQVAYMGLVGSFPFNSFLSGVLSCIGTAVLAVCLRIQVNKDNKEFK
ncbi:hypothetical protein ACJX0J_036724, partial [Zea mays]